jgi:hypothetical protein
MRQRSQDRRATRTRLELDGYGYRWIRLRRTHIRY